MNFTTTALGTVALLALATVATFALPRHVHVTRSAVVSSSPDALIALAASNSGYQQFNPYKSLDPALKIDLFGPSAGIGSGFRFDGRDGKGTQTVVGVTDSGVSYAIDLGAMGKPEQRIEAVTGSDGTQVTWSMDADMGFNPAFRVMGLFMDGMVGPALERGLANLAAIRS